MARIYDKSKFNKFYRNTFIGNKVRHCMMNNKSALNPFKEMILKRLN